jgi:SAM-dependent methyltransferase
MDRVEEKVVKEKVILLVNEFVEFAGTIGKTRDEDFDAGLMERLRLIDDLARTVPDDAARLKRYCFEALSPQADQGTICRHARHKPFGYAGDFRLIDGIYENRTCSEGPGELWDRFFLRQAGAQAVRNRKAYILDILLALGGNRRTEILSLASGPCREMYEFFAEAKTAGYHSFFCLDLDERAVTYARSLLEGLPQVNGRMRFKTGNVFRFRPAGRYDLIWCAGLFDYLDDRMAVSLLKKYGDGWMMGVGRSSEISTPRTRRGSLWSGCAPGLLSIAPGKR